MKSANQLYRESGSELSFKEWLTEQKSKGANLPNPKDMDFKNFDSSSNWLGIPKPIIIVGAVALVGIVYWKFYRKK